MGISHMDTTIEELLAQLNSLDESPKIEAKTSSQLSKSIHETISAFSNEPALGGGCILLGVAHRDNLFEREYYAKGLDDPDKIQADLASQCASVFNLPIRPEVSVGQIDSKAVIAVFIPEASPTDKPVFIKKQGLPRGAYRRIGSTDHHCSEDDLIVLYSGHQQETHDAAIVADTDMDDIDPNMIDVYRLMRKNVNPAAEELSWDNGALLRALKCIRRDANGQMRPTVAGILLFGTTAALRRCFPMMRVDYIRVSGKQWIESPDRRFDTVEIRRPLLLAIRHIQAAIVDDLPKAFSLPEGALQSESRPALPLRVIREAIVNAVMHRNYRKHSPVQIIRYSNRLEIRNPGHSLKSTDQLGEPGSEHRNPNIASALHELDIAETKGSGIRVMRTLMEQNNLLPPTFESERQSDHFIATFLFHHFLGPDDVQWLNDLSADRLSDEEARALVFVREVGAIDNAAYREINHTDTLNASTHLRHLRDRYLLKKKGAGNKTYYVAGEVFDRPESRKPDLESRKPDLESRKPDKYLTTNDLPQELRALVADLPKRPQKQDLRCIIRMLCDWDPMTSVELADILSRKREPLVRDHLAPMVEIGLLAYSIPAMSNHPDQRYRSPEEETPKRGPRKNTR